MREILFRGKRVDNREWVEGSLINSSDGVFILPIDSAALFVEPDYHQQGMGCGLEDRNITDRYEAMQHGWECAVERCAEQSPEFIQVVPETVGQYQNFKVNGVKAFDGDMFSGLQKEQGSEDSYLVKDVLSFTIGGSKVFGRYVQSGYTKDDNELYQFMWCDYGSNGCRNTYWQIDEIKIIGNIHDNPELLTQ